MDDPTALPNIYKDIVDSLDNYAVFAVSKEGIILTWNDGAQEVFSYKRKEIIGKHVSTLRSQEYKQKDGFSKLSKQALKEKVVELEGWYFKKGGKKFWAKGFLYPMRDTHGKVIGFSEIIRDRTERQKAVDEHNHIRALEREALAKSEEVRQSLYSVFTQAPALIAILRGRKGIVELFNPMFEKLWGKRDILGKPMRDAVPELNKQGYFKFIERVYDEGEVVYGNEIYASIDRHGTGVFEDAYFNFVYQPLRDEKGKVDSIIILGLEVTEQVQARKEYQYSQERLDLAQKAGKIGTFEWRIKDNKLIWTPELEALYGLLPGEFQKSYDHWVSMIHPEDVKKVDDNLAHALKNKSKYDVEFRIILPNQTTRWLMAKGDVFFNKKGKAERVVGVNIDITEKKFTEERLRESERHHARVVSTLGEGITLSDMGGVVQTANKAALEILGLSYDQIVGKLPTDPMWKVIKEDGSPFPAEERPSLVTLRTRQPQSNSVMGVYRPDGTLVWVLVNCTLLYEQGNTEPYAMVSSFIDISLRKNLEQQKDLFLGIASHELKTPITSLKLFADILNIQAKNSDQPKLIEIAGMVHSQAERISHLIHDLLDMSMVHAGKLDLKYQQFDMNEVARDIIKSLQLTTTSHLIEYKLLAKHKVSADKDRIEQVLTNLLANAIKYSPKADRIIVRVKENKGNILVEVEDFGQGIPKEEQQKVFDRFFRTEYSKQKNISGFGLGLNISAQIIKRHKGTLTVKSEVGKGSIFCFTLPLKKKD
ncbi:MAG: PAS domain S-box protein [Patescibacteria group bacterium]